MYTAKYVSSGKPGYYRTIHADDVNEASKLAERYARKGYVYVSITKTDSRKD